MVKTKGFKMLILQIDNQVIEKISVQGFNHTHTQMKQGSMKMSCNEDTNKEIENFLVTL